MHTQSREQQKKKASPVLSVLFLFFFVCLFVCLFWWYWDLNSVSHACQEGSPQILPLCQPSSSVLTAEEKFILLTKKKTDKN
jgi:hypothetical protein